MLCVAFTSFRGLRWCEYELSKCLSEAIHLTANYNQDCHSLNSVAVYINCKWTIEVNSSNNGKFFDLQSRIALELFSLSATFLPKVFNQS